VTADSVVSRTYADGRTAPATGSFGGAVTGLVVSGAAVSVQPGGQFPIPGIGWGAVDERRIVRSDGAYRGSEVALHIHLSSDWHNLPAGTEVLLGYSDAAASGHPADQTGAAKAPASPATAVEAARGGESDTNPGLLGAPVVPVPASDGTPTDSGDGVHAHRHRGAPARGLYADASRLPLRLPADDLARLRLPCGRRSSLRPRLRQLPRRHGLPRGQRPVRPGRDAARRRAVRRAAQRGLEPPGRLALVGRGHARQLVLLRAPLGLFTDREGRRPRQCGRRDRLRRQHGRRPGRADAPALRDPPGRPVGRPAVGLPPGLAGPPEPAGGDPRPAAQPPVASSELGATDISAASGLETAAVLAVASGAPVDSGLVALGVPAPTAAELLAAAPAP